MNFSPKKMPTVPSLRSPASDKRRRNFPTSSADFGCNGLASGEALDNTLVTVADFLTGEADSSPFRRRTVGLRNSSSRSSARGLLEDKVSNSTQAPAANRPNMANGTSLENEIAAPKTNIALDLDIDDLFDNQRAEDLHHDAHRQHLPAEGIGEQGRFVFRIHAVDGHKQDRRQGQQHDAREPSFPGQGLD